MADTAGSVNNYLRYQTPAEVKAMVCCCGWPCCSGDEKGTG